MIWERMPDWWSSTALWIDVYGKILSLEGGIFTSILMWVGLSQVYYDKLSGDLRDINCQWGLIRWNGIVLNLLKGHTSKWREVSIWLTITVVPDKLCVIALQSVTPLNEECGMLEWVSNTKGLRNILMALYQERGLYTSGSELRSMALPVSADLS